MNHNLHMVIKRVVMLGGRHLNEPCKKLLLNFIITATNSTEMAIEAKPCLKQKFSTDLKSMGRKLGDPTVYYFETLPRTTVLRDNFPELYAFCFPRHTPVPCQIDLAALFVEDATMKCRSALSSSPSKEEDAMRQFGAFMMRSMEDMQVTQ